jgi:hypothetical protein
MTQNICQEALIRVRNVLGTAVLAIVAALTFSHGVLVDPAYAVTLAPHLEQGHRVDWWFVFKFNAKSFPGCGENVTRTCPFGGEVQNYPFGQQFVVASSESPSLNKGNGCAGTAATDPVGATFGQVYNGTPFYVIWNDQFYGDPAIHGCTKECGSPWGHSKGMLAWDETGAGVVMQVSTPSWPASGSARFPRKSDGNTLGCVNDNDVEVSQHFFALRLTKDDLIKVLNGLLNASVVTDPHNRQLVNSGGPDDVQALVAQLGKKTTGKTMTAETLSTGVQLISKPSALHVPPWQMVSAALGGVPLRVATWWASPEIPSTTDTTAVSCWDGQLGHPGAVDIATQGQWAGQSFGLTGMTGPSFNHAKIGVSTGGGTSYAIFGDMNQQGTLSGNCASSQNGRGGLFYVITSQLLATSVADLIKGASAPQ